MKNCFRCGIGADKSLLFEIITPDGIRSVCRKCSFKVNGPILKEPSQERINESLTPKPVVERLSEASGIDYKKSFSDPLIKKYGSKEDDLKKIVEKNVTSGIKPADEKELIRNFNWIIMRARRSSKLSQDQLGDKINEPAITISYLEKGSLPKDYRKIIKKLENFLNICIFKKDFIEDEKNTLDIEDLKSENYTIGDLKKIKKPVKAPSNYWTSDYHVPKNEYDFNENFVEKNPEVFGDEKESIKIGNEKIEINNRQKNDLPEFVPKRKSYVEKERALTDKEIDDLLFGRK